VRQTLSHSLHEVAIILGTELTESSLLSTFDLFLKDLDQVKAGVVRHLAKFLAVLSPATRETYINTVEDIQSESVNWRFRKLIAKYVQQQP
jgi:serine/threonine-protein phosphatase 4 regulatory subunit 1